MSNENPKQNVAKRNGLLLTEIAIATRMYVLKIQEDHIALEKEVASALKGQYAYQTIVDNNG